MLIIAILPTTEPAMMPPTGTDDDGTMVSEVGTTEAVVLGYLISDNRLGVGTVKVTLVNDELEGHGDEIVEEGLVDDVGVYRSAVIGT